MAMNPLKEMIPSNKKGRRWYVLNKKGEGTVIGLVYESCQEYVYMVHLFPSLLSFLFLSQPVLADHTPFTLYLSTRTYLQLFVLCALFPTRPCHRVTKRVTFPFFIYSSPSRQPRSLFIS